MHYLSVRGSSPGGGGGKHRVMHCLSVGGSSPGGWGGGVSIESCTVYLSILSYMHVHNTKRANVFRTIPYRF